MPVTLHREGVIAVILIDQPPVNALSASVVAGLARAVEEVEADPALRGVILRCAARTFVAGGDITEFADPRFSAAPFNAVLDRIEALDIPVVAELFGTTLGGGLELAMAAHGRVAAAGTRLGLPEITLGLIPGSHGTQRLPRIAGVERAYEMISSGKPIAAAEALAAGLVDRVAPAGDLAAASAALIADLRAAPLPRAGLKAVAGDIPATVARAQAEAARRPWLPALAAIATALAAAGGDFATGKAVEARLFRELMAGAVSRAQRHLFLAERAAQRIPGLPPGTPVRTVEQVGILGIGTMGAGIAMNFALAGMPVRLVETTAEALERGMARLDTTFAQLVKRGRLTEAQAAERRALMTGSTDLSTLSQVDIVVEAVFEDMALKLDVAARLGAACKPGAIIATNTSTLDIDEIATASGRPADVLGTHFFSPAHIMRLLEIVRGRQTAPEVLQTVLRLARRIGKTAVVSGVCYGFIGNRMAEVYMRESEAMQLQGTSPQRIDAVIESPEWLGMAMGPSRMLDMAGVDVGARTVIEWIKSGEGPQDPLYRIIARTMFTEGLHGQKTGQGYYRYAGRDASANPAHAAMVGRLRAAHGIAESPMLDDREIFERLLFPMVNEAARILEEGIAFRGGDIDVVWTAGYGFPAWRGGPLFLADAIGLARIVERLDHYARSLGNGRGYWTVAPLLRELAAGGRRISDWQGGAAAERAAPAA
ncbi:3-hydroxyacyl-CoA dehydrogenase [Haematobacter massiliensis]|uniref:3-hydroxyacyl-CoA dehydrogenase n=2 Tax=Haematobacter massiliensis TaxID=195105 RepID=A0A086Y2A1_9RHOB|nr:3-hydroxyacyl-CoA dehydrogenase NAD-binding domain-containing protein [Haematobacter massiliensis]KFI28401.1 3-hydroxyacyl-CoA dehydrogenase [Haematobacter massiliensis]OWJ84658.1 enoyl-CoA hydratase [Haematobacter massiliensis]